MYHYQIGISPEIHDEFVKKSELANLLQSSAWANVKNQWDNEIVGFFKDEQLVASASLLYRSLPFGFTMCYVARGPILDYKDKELLQFVFTSLKTIAKRKKSLFVKCDPSLVLSKTVIHKDCTTCSNPETKEIIQSLQVIGVIWSGLSTEMSQTIQPRIQAKIYKEGFEENLPKSTKQAIRTALNKGIEVKYGREELLDDFTTLMRKTEVRKDIHLRNEEYYHQLLAAYENSSFITIAYLDLEKRLEELESKLAKNKLAAEAFSQETKPGKIKNNEEERERLVQEIAFLNTHIESGVKVAPLSGTLTIEFGTTSVNLYAGMDDTFKQYNAPILTWYSTAKQSFDRGTLWQNLGGVEGDFKGGLYLFKSKYSPTIEEYIGELTIPIHPLYPLGGQIYKLRKKLRKSIYRKKS